MVTTWTGPILLPNHKYAGSWMNTFSTNPPDLTAITRARPVSTPRVARVTMNSGRRKRVMKKPFTRPIKPPIAMTTGTNSHTGRELYTRKLTQIIAAKPTMAPTEMSMPPVIITKVNPTAMIPMSDASWSKVMMLPRVRNAGLAMERATPKASSKKMRISRRNEVTVIVRASILLGTESLPE